MQSLAARDRSKATASINRDVLSRIDPMIVIEIRHKSCTTGSNHGAALNLAGVSGNAVGTAWPGDLVAAARPSRVLARSAAFGVFSWLQIFDFGLLSFFLLWHFVFLSCLFPAELVLDLRGSGRGEEPQRGKSPPPN